MKEQHSFSVKPDKVVHGKQSHGEILASENVAIGRAPVERGLNASIASKGFFAKRFVRNQELPWLDDIAQNTTW